MTESAKNFERCTGADDAKGASSLGAELLACKAAGDLFRQQNSSSARELTNFPSGKELLAQLSEAQHGPRCEAPTHEKRGAIDVTIDEYGEMVAVNDNHGNSYTKNYNGKWTRHYQLGSEDRAETIDNLKVDRAGNLSYDYNDDARNVHVHHEQSADGSWRYTNEFGAFAYDKNLQLVEAPAGDGHVRKFHYTNGQLDAIDGRLGHWDRVEKDGQVSWVNKDTGAVWDGDFKVNIASDMLEYRGRNGAAWDFTPWGTDINKTGEKE